MRNAIQGNDLNIKHVIFNFALLTFLSKMKSKKFSLKWILSMAVINNLYVVHLICLNVMFFLFLFSSQLEIMTNIAGETSIGTILREFQVSTCKLTYIERLCYSFLKVDIHCSFLKLPGIIKYAMASNV